VLSIHTVNVKFQSFFQYFVHTCYIKSFLTIRKLPGRTCKKLQNLQNVALEFKSYTMQPMKVISVVLDNCKNGRVKIVFLCCMILAMFVINEVRIL